jgi:hypothetical protein
MPKIVDITDGEFSHGTGYSTGYDGYVVTLSNSTQIKIGVSNSPDCCEQWGYFSTDDDPQRFIGAEFLGLERTEAGQIAVPGHAYGLDGGDTMFVDVLTDQGKLRLAVYNAHNGYYGHSAVLIVGDALVLDETL